MKRKVCLLIPYYGAWPEYMPLFLDSIGRNRDLIDVVFVTDLAAPPCLPDNVRLVTLTLPALCAQASQILSLPIDIRRPYKLCDLRPAYGLIFEDIIAAYSHWAFGDIDVIYGSVAALLPDDWYRHDVLVFREEWVTGSLAIFRNTPVVNALFRRSGDYEKFFTAEPNFCFDECLRFWNELINRGPDVIFTVDAEASLTAIVRRAEQAGELSVFRQRLIKESIPAGDWVFCCDGRVRDKAGVEFLFYHLITEKKTHRFVLPRWQQAPQRFYIDRYGMHEPADFLVGGYRRMRRLRELRSLWLGGSGRLRRLPSWLLSRREQPSA